MVVSCSAYGCTNRFSKEKKLQFHRFPLENPKLLQKWVIAIRRASWQPSNYSRLCSDHFTVESYKSMAKRYLNDDAVPSIFNFSTHLKKKNVKAEKVITEHELPNISQTDSKNTPLSSACNLKNIPDHLNCSNKNNDLLHTQNRKVPVASSLSPATSFQNHATCSEAKISSDDPDCYKILMFPSSKFHESGPTKQQLHQKIKSLREKLRRRDMKIRMLETVIAQTKKVAEMNYKTINLLPNTLGSIPVELIVDELKNSSVKPQDQKNSCQFVLKGHLCKSNKINQKQQKKIKIQSANHVLGLLGPLLADFAL